MNFNKIAIHATYTLVSTNRDNPNRNNKTTYIIGRARARGGRQRQGRGTYGSRDAQRRGTAAEAQQRGTAAGRRRDGERRRQRGEGEGIAG